MSMYSRFYKRAIDIVFALILLIAFSPVMLLIYMLITFTGGKALFTQSRLGRNKSVFKLYKFRTMVVDADRHLNGQGCFSRNRITKLGKYLRVSSLDELPQLVNIAKGQMSFIGPRPVLAEWADKFDLDADVRFTVRPGITGLAQINGRNMIPWSKRVEYDLEYIGKLSFLFDIKILLRTVLVILKPRDVSLDRNSEQMDDL